MVNDHFEGIIQVNSVKPGTFGGAIFSGRVIGNNRIYVCKADYKKLLRSPLPGECYFVKGSITAYEQYKNFVAVDECNVVCLPKAAYVERFLLKHPSFKGFYFGKAKIKKLLDAFGAEALVDSLNTAKVSHLAEIIPSDLALKIVETWQKIQNEIDLTSFLIDNNIDISIAYPILKVCKENTVQRISNNIYGLVVFRGVIKNIWQLIEAMKLKLDICDTDERRLIGAVEYTLYDELDFGHTACPVSNLKNKLTKLLASPDLVQSALDLALNKKVICVIDGDGEIFVQPIGIAIIESQVEIEIKRLRNLLPHSINGSTAELESRIKHYNGLFADKYGYRFSNRQSLAIQNALSSRISLITGFGGTGKTTVLKAIVDLSKTNVFVLALSGKAKERAKIATGIDEAYTIHAFIQQLKDKKCVHDLSNEPLIIIDEASMVDITLVNQLFSVIKLRTDNFNLLMVGDTAQLSPVGIGLFWHRLAGSETISTIHLDQVHRTNSDGSLHKVAMDLRDGILPKLENWNGESEGIYLVECPPYSKDLCSTLLKLKQKLPDSQIITPTIIAGYADSGKTINEYIQYGFNHSTAVIQLGNTWLKLNDPVLVTKNNYEHSLFNGTTGTLVAVEYDEDGEAVGVFEFDQNIHYLRKSDCWQLGIKLAYAISIHKSQGSEYNTSIICAVNPTSLFERSMLYTAVTRSKWLSLIVGSQEIARAAAARSNRADQLNVGFMTSTYELRI